jgi:putative SOS response-associated peptidase YedK
MCGRYATTRSAADLSALFEAVDETAGPETAGPDASGPDASGDQPDVITPRYNVAPTDPVPVVRVSREGGARVLAVGRWGLLPHWARDRRQGARMINARAETVATARAYADSFATRRALIPADGWYEWLRDRAGGRQAYFMTPRDGSVLAFAGLWSRWGPDRLLTFSVVTTAAVGELAAVHDRMPLVLPASRWERWLAADPPPIEAPSPELLAGLEVRPVGRAVGNVRNDGPELVKRVDISLSPAPTQPALF